LRAELERILSSRRFRKSARTSRLLCYLAQRAVTGGGPIDECSIAAEVFGRPATFVPQIDPVVPVEFRRLRDALEIYYLGEGKQDPLLLEAGGGYGLVVWDPAGDYASHRWRRRMLPVLLAAALALSAAAWWQFRPYHVDPEATRLQQTARDLRARGSREDLEHSLVAFERAVALDPRNSPAWSGLADALCSTGLNGAVMSREEAMAKAQDAANRAIRLDARNAEAHAALAYMQFLENRNWTAAEAEFRLALRLDPSAPATRRRYAQCLMSRGRFDEAIAESKAAASLEPRNAPLSTGLAEILVSARRYDDAMAEAQRLVQARGGDPAARLALGVCLAAEERYNEAIEEFQLAVRASGSPYALARLGNAYGGKNDRAAAFAILERLDEYFQRTLTIYWSYRAMVFAGMGDTLRTVDNLERASEAREGDINFIGVDPAYDRVRNEGPFLVLRGRLELP